jgi:hypothetical protein
MVSHCEKKGRNNWSTTAINGHSFRQVLYLVVIRTGCRNADAKMAVLKRTEICEAADVAES